jgi:hypothetical protein
LRTCSGFVYGFGEAKRAREPINMDKLRDKVAVWLDKVNASEWSTWQGNTVDSNDVRWLAAHLADESGEVLPPPWPAPDQPQPFTAGASNSTRDSHHEVHQEVSEQRDALNSFLRHSGSEGEPTDDLAR